MIERERSAALQERQKKLTEMRQKLAESTEQEKDVIQSQADEARKTLEADARRMASAIGRASSIARWASGSQFIAMSKRLQVIAFALEDRTLVELSGFDCGVRNLAIFLA